MFKSGEIERAIKMFENPSLQRSLPYTGGRLDDKADRTEWKAGCYYNNGALNDQFLAFLSGYSAGKAVGQA